MTNPIALTIVAIIVLEALAVICAVYGDSKILGKLMDGVTRQPEAKDALFTNALIGCGLVESMPIIVTVVVLILIFANPFLK